MQYTIRNVPKKLDAELRRRAKQQGKSLNQVAVEALTQGAGVSADNKVGRNLDFLIGSMKTRDPKFEQALKDQRRIDPEMWR